MKLPETLYDKYSRPIIAQLNEWQPDRHAGTRQSPEFLK